MSYKVNYEDIVNEKEYRNFVRKVEDLDLLMKALENVLDDGFSADIDYLMREFLTDSIFTNLDEKDNIRRGLEEKKEAYAKR